jgi:hypothetical protein
VSSSPAISQDGTIYFGSWDSYLYAINPDGRLKWKFETEGYVYSSPAISQDGTIYFGSWDSYLYAINPDGSLKWKFKTGNNVYSSPAISQDGTIYFGSDYLYAINPDGSLKWKFKTGSYVVSSPAISQDGTIYFGSYDNYLYAINPDGRLKWEFETGGSVSSSPAISQDGTIYFGSDDSWFYALKTDSYGLAKSNWPKFRNNLQNTGFQNIYAGIGIALKESGGKIFVKNVIYNSSSYRAGIREGNRILKIAGAICDNLKEYEANNLLPRQVGKKVNITFIDSSGEQKEAEVYVELYDIAGNIIKPGKEPTYIAKEPPKLLFETEIIEKDNDLIIRGGESINIKVRVSNEGGKATGVRVKLSGSEILLKYLGNEKIVGELNRGESKSVSFYAELPDALPSQKERIMIEVYCDGGYYAEKRDKYEIALKPKEIKVVEAGAPIDVDIVPEIAKEKKKNAYAIVIGIEDYKDKNIPKVPYAKRSSDMMKKYLIDVLGYEEKNIYLLQNEEATKGNIEVNIEGRLQKLVRNETDEVFIYYTGHGVPDITTEKDAYILPYDGNPNFIETGGYRLSKMYKVLESLKSKKVIVVLDSCFSGRGAILPRGAAPIVIELENAISVSDKFTVFTSSKGNELSLAYEEMKHRLFTYFFLKGLKGEADRDGDGKIDAIELYNYAKENVDEIARRQGQDQTPQILPNEELIKERRVVIR